MCGLTGILCIKPHVAEGLSGRIRAMTDRLRHRGPDAEGYWTDDGIALGHRRLSIIDLSEAGAQPMLSACERFVIVFNGEIYNHAEMRHELEMVGAAPQWRGHSDTETLLAGIVHWGPDETLRRAYGMFALALWDRRERRLVLARDRIGEKPLYWGWAGDALVFGSELKALRAYPGFQGKICHGALTQYLRFGYVPAPRSIHSGIYKLEPGCVLEIDGVPPTHAPAEPLRPCQRHGTISIRRYWSLNAAIEDGHGAAFTDEAEALASLEQVLDTAVGRQMMADVPLGAFLSGGIDSSLIVALMQRQSAQRVKTFTIGFETPSFDEAPHATAVAKHLGTEHHEMLVTEAEAREVIPHLPDLYDEPFADSSQIPTHLVCRAARQNVTVALSGDAGDELFGGYNRYFWGPGIWRRLGWVPRPLRRTLATGITTLPVPAWDRIGALSARMGASGTMHFGDKAHKLAVRLASATTLDELYRGLVSIWERPQALVRRAVSEPPSALDDDLPGFLGRDPVSRMMVQDMRSYLPDDILCKVDRAAMGISLETRAPFLDPAVIAISTRIPNGMKIREGKGKWPLRQILYKYVPRDLIERPKAGFGIPVGDWLRGPLRPWAENLLDKSRLVQGGLLDPVPIRQAWLQHLSGRRDWTHRLWIILMLQAWQEQKE